MSSFLSLLYAGFITALCGLALLTSILAPVLMVREHRRRDRMTSPGQPEAPGTPQPGPGIAWVLQGDADPAAVARLQAGLARPVAGVIAEGERRAIAAAYPLAGDPREACVVNPPLTAEQDEVMRKRLLEATRAQWQVASPGSGVPVSGGGGGGSTSVEATGAFGDWEYSFTPAQPEQDVLTRLREQRKQAWGQANLASRQACDEDQPPAWRRLNLDRLDRLMYQLEVLDKQIRGILDVRHGYQRGEL